MPEGSAALQLQVGDRVVYPNQGVCRVAAIDVKEVAGQSLTFVTMRREEDGAVVMVPQGKILSIGVRKVASPTDVEEIYAFLRSDSDKADLDWKQRARTNLDRMTQGGILGLAEVVKGLQVLSELRPLPTKERELYDNARHLLVSEVAAALGTAEANAEDSIDIVLFPPGKERPKRTAAEFARPGGEEDDMDLDGDLMGLEGGELDLPSDEEPQSESESEGESSEEEGGEEEGGEEGGEDAPKKRGRPPKAKPAEGEEAAAPKKRGRPPKPKPEVAEGAEPAAPKKRGRPPKAKPPEGAAPAEPAAPKKRGRPPKAKPPEDE
ncbi:transcriptional regulator [Corallococcus exiguus]|uniref:CarD family transcriptional regulator n=1 Tax=Corallococcus TaxID=83461 RepID=UPI000EC0BEB6|nr:MULTISPECIES: CarD family transcriptional regulator [Corallococcus]NNB85475.1 transcriptional regulator [Corallococcus exiguus]NNC02263.1 transcriptional regulator [Corallococcus exiguus]NPC46516.1 transcriptional regulator [Corallococcus exiguus]RKH81947.1 transcriptional regulator [Corallococcus sp. AB032C]